MPLPVALPNWDDLQSRFDYLQPLPQPHAAFIVTGIELLLTNDDSLPDSGVMRDSYFVVRNGYFAEIGSMANMPRRLRDEIFNRSLKEIDFKDQNASPGFMHGHTHLCQSLWSGQGVGKQLLEWLRDHTWPGEAALNKNEIATAAHWGAAQVLAYGATTVLDMGTVHHTLPYAINGIYPTGLRAFTGNVVMDRMDPEVPFSEHLHQAPSIALERTLETMEALAEFSDLSQGQINPAVTMRFLLTSEAETAKALAAMARKKGLVLQTHASENTDEVAAIRARFGAGNIEQLAKLDFLGEKTFLHHAIHVSEEEIRAMAASRTTAVHCPGSNGMLGSGVAPVASMLACGLDVAIGADGSPCNDGLNIRNEMWAAQILAGAHFQNSRLLTPAQIFRMATVHGARGLGLEGRIGRIKPGYEADFVGWDRRQLENLIDLDSSRDVIGRMVRTTDRAKSVFVKGRQVVTNGKPLFIRDHSSFRRAVNSAARSVLGKSMKFRVEIPFLVKR